MNARRFQIDLSPKGRGLWWYLVGGLVLAGYGGYRMCLTATLLSVGRPAQARVTYMDHMLRSPDEAVDPWHNKVRWSSRAYRTVNFTAGSGQRVVDQSRWSAANYHRDDAMIRQDLIPRDRTAAILHNPGDPAQWLFDDPTSLWVTPLVCLFVGGILLFYAWAVRQGWITPPRIRFVTRPRPPNPAAGPDAGRDGDALAA